MKRLVIYVTVATVYTIKYCLLCFVNCKSFTSAGTRLMFSDVIYFRVAPISDCLAVCLHVC